MIPITEKFHAVDHRESHRETTQRIQYAVIGNNIIGIEIHRGNLKSLHVSRTIDDQSRQRDRIRLVIRIYKICTSVLGGVIRQKSVSYHRVQFLLSLLRTHLHDALALLVFANLHVQTSCLIPYREYGFTYRLVHVWLFHIVPELTIINHKILQESNVPISCSLISPIGRKELFPSLLHRLDALDLESPLSVAFNEVERLGILRQWREMECHIKFAILLRQRVLIQLNAISGDNSIMPVACFQIGIITKHEPRVGIVRTLHRCDIHHRLAICQFHFRHIKRQVKKAITITCSIFCRWLFPHHLLLSHCHHCDKRQHESKKCSFHCLFLCFRLQS